MLTVAAKLLLVFYRFRTEAGSVFIHVVLCRRFEEVVRYKDQRLRPAEHLRCYASLRGDEGGPIAYLHLHMVAAIFRENL